MKYITEQSELPSILPTLMSKQYWGVDCETTGLDCNSDKVTLLQIGDMQDQFVIDTRRVNPEPLREFLESENIDKVGHNLKFDYKMLKTNFGICIDSLKDTYLGDKIISMGMKQQGFGLADNLDNYLKVKVDKALQKSFIGHRGDFSQEQLEYAANDVKYLPSLLIDGQLPRLLELGLEHTFNLESNCVPCFGDMEVYGLLLDKEKWMGIAKENLRKANELIPQMDDYARPYWAVNMFDQVEINYGSPKQVVELLQKMGALVKERDRTTGKDVFLKVESSEDKVLRKIDGCAIIPFLQDYRSYMVLVGTFGQSFVDGIHPKTGRIHPEFHQIGTETGRPATSSDSPVNMLNIPREKAMRNSFIAPPDYLIETDDYSGCELRILAHLSKDPQLCGALRRGEDLHCYVASKLYGKPVSKTENAHLRTPAKSLNFGIAYGMSYARLYNELNGAKFYITFEEAKGLYDKYCQEFKVAVDFLRNNGKLAVKQGYLANANGRRRNWIIPESRDLNKFPKGYMDPKYQGILSSIGREGGNFLIQSVNADITKTAMINMRKHTIKNKIRSNIMLQVYDEVVTCTHKDDAEEWREKKREIMIESARIWIDSVPIEVDGHVLPYWTK